MWPQALVSFVFLHGCLGFCVVFGCNYVYFLVFYTSQEIYRKDHFPSDLGHLSSFLRHDIAATCVLKMPLNLNHPSIHFLARRIPQHLLPFCSQLVHLCHCLLSVCIQLT